MKKFNRVIVLVLDGFGVGELPDAAKFGDEGSDTFGHLLKIKPQLQIPHLESLGLKNIVGQDYAKAGAVFAKMKEISAGKDTTTGHWEMMGLPVQKAFDTFPNGFPKNVMDEFVAQNNLKGYLGNYPASGTDIISQLGEEHIQSLKPIVYTSADSVFQIAAHEKFFGLDRLYEVCRKTRALLNESGHLVGRVIARPFVGDSVKNFQRTPRRKDFSVKPFAETVLTQLKSADFSVTGIGKISSIYDGEGITQSFTTESDEEAINVCAELLKNDASKGLVFCNLNDLDMLFGHRRNPKGYIEQLEKIDSLLPKILNSLTENDLLMISSDHGNDPSFKGTDHTREYVPLLMSSPCFRNQTAQALSTRESFCDIGQSILDNFDLKPTKIGKSFLSDLKL
ncbi:MAG: phosphopentomutase [Bdellovibrionota bacterium]